eukprot:NODE_241_length_11910_cov_1.082381.p10 type:complete len:167 gc:universal NODE_241_length_11910_cov_1.082381:6409-5909(-)
MMGEEIDWVLMDVRYKPNNRYNKLTGTIPYNSKQRYCDKYHHYNLVKTENFQYYQMENPADSEFPKNVVELMYDVSADAAESEEHLKIVEHRIYELYQKEYKRNEELWKIVDYFLDNQNCNKELLKLVGQSDIYLFTLKNVLDGFSEIARLKLQHSHLTKRNKDSN